MIVIPKWARNRCQPISIRDVVKYLVGVLEVPETAGKSFDIGGKDILTYEEMLRGLAKVLGKATPFVYSPFGNIPVFAYWASLLTPVPNAITQCLMRGLRNEVICLDESIKRFIPFEPISYKEAVVRAMSREEQDKVHTRWSDAYPPSHELALKLHECKEKIGYTTCYSLLTEKEAPALFDSICRIGGREGWFYGNWMWGLRGMLDRVLLGVGTSRGRKSSSQLQINDVIDFWRIEDLKQDERLLLRAEMKLPGKAWLEFMIGEEENKRRLAIIGHYYTNTIIGKIYWYACLPFHRFVFKELIKGVQKSS